MKRGKVRIITADVGRLRQFYELVIKLEPVGDERYVEFRLPGLTLAIADQRRINMSAAGAATPGSNRSAVFDFEVENVDAEYDRLRTIVDTFELVPTTQPWGNRSMLFRDPDGNLVNFFAPVHVAAVNR